MGNHNVTEITNTVAQATASTSASKLEFDDFYRKHSRSLMSFACILTKNEKEAEDLTQDVFADVHRQWHKVQQCENPRAWVRKIMTNKSTSRIRRNIVEQKAMTKIAARPLRAVNETVIESPEIRSAVKSLPTRQAQAIVLKYWEDRTVEEIAEILDCGSETVKTHLRRGRAAMAQSLHAFNASDNGSRHTDALPLAA